MPEPRGLVKRYSDKAMIFEEGDIGDYMYVVNSGSVRIYRKREGRTVEYGTIKRGEFFGEMALFSEHARSASAQAKGETELQLLDAQTFVNSVKDPLVLSVIKKLTERIRDIDDRVESLSVQDQVRKEHLSSIITQHRRKYF